VERQIHRTNKSIVLIAVTAMLVAAYVMVAALVPVQAHAASKKTVYVITKIAITNSSGTTIDSYTYKYNKHGLVKKRAMKSYGDTIESKYYTYNKAKQITKCVTKDSRGKKDSVEKYTYKKGILAKMKYTWYIVDTKGKKTYTFDENGTLVKEEGGNSDGSNQYVGTYKYYSNGLMKSQKGFMENKKFKYDKKGKCVKEYSDGRLFMKYKNTYVSKSSKRLKSVRWYNKDFHKYGYFKFTYKKMKVSKADAKLVKKQQVQPSQDPIFELFY